MATGDRRNPFVVFRFLVEIDGLAVGGFTEVSGLSVETETEDYWEGGLNSFLHKIVKGTKYPNLILRRGITLSDVLWKWHWDVAAGRIRRESGSVILMDYEGNEKQRWSFFNAYPVKWSASDLKSDSSTIAIETLELVHEGIDKA